MVTNLCSSATKPQNKTLQKAIYKERIESHLQIPQFLGNEPFQPFKIVSAEFKRMVFSFFCPHGQPMHKSCQAFGSAEKMPVYVKSPPPVHLQGRPRDAQRSLGRCAQCLGRHQSSRASWPWEAGEAACPGGAQRREESGGRHSGGQEMPGPPRPTPLLGPERPSQSGATLGLA